MASFGPKPWVNLNFSTFWTSSFYSLNWRFFILEYRKTHFPALFRLKNKNMEKWPILDQIAKITFFPLFEHAVFIA